MSRVLEFWGNPVMLWGLALVPMLVIAYAIDGQRRRRLLERVGHAPMIARMTASARAGSRRWRAVLNVVALTLLVLTLARPQAAGRARLVGRQGLDLVVALDMSRSMLAKDVYPSRLERAKVELGRLIDTLKGDRVGLVAFAGETLSYPLTVDYASAKLFWRDLGPDDMPVGGTDLGRAIQASIELLTRAADSRGTHKSAQVILLLTDGEDTEGKGAQAAEAAAKAGIRLFTIGLGSAERPFVQLYDEKGKANGYVVDDAGNPVRVGIDEAALKQMARATGGDYIAIDPGRFGVERVQQAIAGLQREEEEARLVRMKDDVGRWFLLPAFFLLLLESVVRERRRGQSGQSSLLASWLLVMMLPMLSGFDVWKRREPHVERGNQLLEAGKAEEALKEYDEALRAYPEDPIMHLDRGSALYALKRYPEAQREFLRAAEAKEPALKADAHYNSGNSLYEQQRYKDALEEYRRTLSLRPDDKRAKWNLELALRRMKEEKKQQDQQNKDQQNKDPQNKDQQQAQQNKDQQNKDPQNKDQQQQAQQNKDQQNKDQQNKDQQNKDQQNKDQQQQAQQKDQQQKDPQAQKDAPSPSPSASGATASAGDKEAPREIDRQDAEAVLDALERVEPTVQKELARRRAGSRRPRKDW